MTLLASGTLLVKTRGKEWGLESVHVPDMKCSDEVLLTAYVTNGNSGPDRKGPLYCPFIDKKEKDGFTFMVYDIQANPFDVEVRVDWLVARGRE